jgi:outer membrane protein OmpA-like peptidoglycan-associated protein
MRKLNIIFIGLLSVFIFGGLTLVSAAPMDSNSNLRSISGVISEINVILGEMQLSRDAGQDTKGIEVYTITLHNTRVTDPTDTKFYVIKDLQVGQHVTVEFMDDSMGNPKVIMARKITVDAIPGTAGVATPMAAKTAVTSNSNSGLVGPRGATGSAGQAGEQGLSGSQGPSGVALRGPRGERGETGSMGEQGFTGAQGPAGDLARGSAGEVGPAGARGQQGEVGKMGEEGDSFAGYAGPKGATGQQGERGPAGDTGAKGATLQGPAGPAGFAGSAGNQGIVGEQGLQGSTREGLAGLAGPTGASGAIGKKGATGDQGRAGIVGGWELYKEFTFNNRETSLSAADLRMVKEITSYINKNPSLQIGLDGTAVRSSDQRLNDTRLKVIRAALIDAGVSSDKITMDAIGDRDLRREGRIAVLFNTTQDSLSRN